MGAPRIDFILGIECIEVTCGDRLWGYAICFSGRWDAWELQPGYTHLRRIGTFDTHGEAMAALGWKPMNSGGNEL